MTAYDYKNLLGSRILRSWRNGDVSLGKAAELLQMDKNELRRFLSNMGLALIDYPVEEVAAEVELLRKC